MKEQWDIDNENEIHEITAAITPWKGKPACVTCNQTFEMENGLKIISRKSTLSSGDIIMAKYSEIYGSRQSHEWSMWINLSWMHLVDDKGK